MKQPAYKLAWWGSMYKQIAPRENRMCAIDGLFKTYEALEAVVHETFGWQSGAFNEIHAYRKRVTLREWEQAKG